jgi:hypothetical protein
MTVSVVFAIAGVIALLFGIIGGGIKAKEIEIPNLSPKVRVITIIVGLALIGITAWLENNKVSEQASTSPPLAPSTINAPPVIEVTATEDSAPNNIPTVTATPVPTISSSDKLYSTLNEAKTWNLVLQESFDDNNNNWSLRKDDDDKKIENMQINAGVFQWGLKVKGSARYELEIAPLSSYSNFYLSAKVRRIGDPANEQGRNQAIWGLIFRRQGGDFYALHLNDLQEYSLLLHNGDGWTDLVGRTQSSLVNINKSNELAVVLDGPEISFYINGVPIKTIIDNNLSEGNIGFYASLNYPDEDVKFEFDDVELRVKP